MITDAGDFLQMASANLVKFGEFGEFMEIRRTIRVPSNFLSGVLHPSLQELSHLCQFG